MAVTMRCSLLFITLCYLLLEGWCCEPYEYQNRCKIVGNICTCGFGCSDEFIFTTRRACNIERQKQHLRALQAQTTPPPQFRSYSAPLTPNSWPNTPPPTPLRTQNICESVPCLRGYCLQTVNDPGYACKCESTGFYGLRCEKACPTIPISGRVFPHECIII